MKLRKNMTFSNQSDSSMIIAEPFNCENKLDTKDDHKEHKVKSALLIVAGTTHITHTRAFLPTFLVI